MVRGFTVLGSIEPLDRTFEATATVPIAEDWAVASISVVGLLQERGSRRIVGAGSARIAAPSTAPRSPID